MAILSPEHLLEQAVRLASPLATGAPRQADLRRAISSAYYALFHAIAAQAGDTFAGRTNRGKPNYSLVYRSVGHRSLRELCEDVQKRTLPQKYMPYVPSGGFGADLLAVAVAVVDLQEKRHSADYDPLFRVSASDATLAISTARAAVERLARAGRGVRRTFISLLVFSPRR